MVKSIFSSFWMAGYECSDQLNCYGNRVDLLQETKHVDCIDDDYKALNLFGISTVREGVRWSKAEYAPFTYDWSDTIKLLSASKRHQVQIIWDLCHFGYPDDLTPLHPQFCERFVKFACSFVTTCRFVLPDTCLVITPINEVSFLSWLGGEVAATSPYTRDYGWQVKYQLSRAYIAAIRAMKSIDNNLKILTTEPLINILPDNFEDTQQVQATLKKNLEQYQVLDMLTGRACPELGGSDDLVDIVGCNYYHNNQWFYPSEKQLDWRISNEINGHRSLSDLCKEVINRYNKPIVLTETSHHGVDKSSWIRYISQECKKMLLADLALLGVCIYPILDRPDWDHPEHWHDSGVWRIEDQTHRRIIYEEYAQEIITSIEELENVAICNFSNQSNGVRQS